MLSRVARFSLLFTLQPAAALLQAGLQPVQALPSSVGSVLSARPSALGLRALRNSRAASFGHFQPLSPSTLCRPGPSAASRLFGASRLMASVVPTAVSAEWLKDNVDKVKVLDASWYLPIMERSPGVKFDARGEFEKRRIPGAYYFDIDSPPLCMPDSDWPHMMPSPQDFAKAVGSYGIGKQDHVVVYDGHSVFSAPRAWFMFRAFGHEKVSILDGGFPKWESAGGLIETETKSADARAPQAVTYECSLLPNIVLEMAQVEMNIASNEYQMIDGRPMGRFLGEAPEPRPIESGHIAGSYCVPWSDVLADGKYKTKEELLEVFKKAKVDIQKPCAVTCGSGVSACVVGGALDLVGAPLAPLYDGAYVEWKTTDKPTYKGSQKSPYDV